MNDVAKLMLPLAFSKIKQAESVTIKAESAEVRPDFEFISDKNARVFSGIKLEQGRNLKIFLN
jgi:hypothetical protein